MTTNEFWEEAIAFAELAETLTDEELDELRREFLDN